MTEYSDLLIFIWFSQNIVTFSTFSLEQGLFLFCFSLLILSSYFLVFISFASAKRLIVFKTVKL
jgi:hypothetical protein